MDEALGSIARSTHLHLDRIAEVNPCHIFANLDGLPWWKILVQRPFARLLGVPAVVDRNQCVSAGYDAVQSKAAVGIALVAAKEIGV